MNETGDKDQNGIKSTVDEENNSEEDEEDDDDSEEDEEDDSGNEGPKEKLAACSVCVDVG